MTTNLQNPVSTDGSDVVGIFDTEYNQLFSGAKIIKASVTPSANFFKQPLEDSTTRVDHVVVQPMEISLGAIVSGVNYREIYQQIFQAFKVQTQLIVRTKVGSYDNMYIQSMPHDEAAESFDVIVISFNLEETLLSSVVEIFIPQAQADSSTVDRGLQEGQETENKSSILSRLLP